MDSKDIANKWKNKPSTAKPAGRIGPGASDILEKLIKDKPGIVPKAKTPAPAAAQSPVQPAPSPLSPESASKMDTGELTLKDVLEGKFNPLMMYRVPLDWISYEDSANYNRDPIEVVEKSEGFLSLVESIKSSGQKIPGMVRPNPATGRIQITDGWRRALACRKGKVPTYLCLLTNSTDVDAAVEALALNLLREDLPEYKKLDEIKKLHDQYDLTYDEISRRTGFGTKGNISEALLVYEFPEIEKPFREKRISLNQARVLARVAKREKLEPRQITNFAKQIEAKDIQLKELPFLAKDGKKKGSGAGKAEVFFYSPTKDGGFFYRCKLDPKKPNVREWQKAIDKAKEMIENLQKAIKNEK